MTSTGPQTPGSFVVEWATTHWKLSIAWCASFLIVLTGIIAGVNAHSATASTASQAAAQQQEQTSQNNGGSDSSGTSAGGAATDGEAPSATPTPSTSIIQLDNPVLTANGTLEAGDGPVILPAATTPIDTSTLFSRNAAQTYMFDVVTDTSSGSQAYEGLVQLYYPANGLKPSYYNLDFVRISADGSSVTAEKTLVTANDQDNASPQSVYGTTDGLLIAGTSKQDSNGDEIASTWALDSAGGTVWKKQATLQTVVQGVPVVRVAYGATDANGNPTTCNDVDGLNARTGATLWSVSGSAFLKGDGDCTSPDVPTDNTLNDGSSSAPSPRYVTVQYNDGSGSPAEGVNIIPTTGARVNWRPTDAVTDGLVDPVTGDVFSGESEDNDGKGLPAEVYDPKTGKVLWSMSYDQANKLGLDVKYIYAGKLYATNSSQNITIDVASGSVDTTEWTDGSGDDGTGTGVPIGVVDGYTITTTGAAIPRS